jgi:putative ABC transport system ATP-binding protein
MIVSLHEVTKTYGSKYIETKAVNGVSFEIGSGDYVAIMGESGSGKSTLITLIGLLDVPTSGRLMIDGMDSAQASEAERAVWRRERLGFVFQAFHLIPHLSVVKNVELALDTGKMSRAERREAANSILSSLGMDARAQHFPAQLSGGQQQRVALARAIVRRPQLLICDEPTGNLDSANGDAVMDIVDRLNADGTAVLVVTHSQSVASRANRQFSMKDGVLAGPVS